MIFGLPAFGNCLLYSYQHSRYKGDVPFQHLASQLPNKDCATWGRYAPSRLIVLIK